MKKLLLALLAFVIVLGTSCKKEVNEPKNPTELSEKKTEVLKVNVNAQSTAAALPPSPNIYPHNTGICYCGKYAGCNPKPPVTHASWCNYYKGDYDTPGACNCQLENQ